MSTNAAALLGASSRRVLGLETAWIVDTVDGMPTTTSDMAARSLAHIPPRS